MCNEYYICWQNRERYSWKSRNPFVTKIWVTSQNSLCFVPLLSSRPLCFSNSKSKPVLSRYTWRSLGNYFVLPGVMRFLWSNAAGDFWGGGSRFHFLGVTCNTWVSPRFHWLICLLGFFFVINYLTLQVSCANNILWRKQNLTHLRKCYH